MQRRETLPCPRARAAVLALLSAAAVLPADAGEHAFGEFVINVRADGTGGEPATDYQVTVENAELLLTRLSAPLAGNLSNSFVADLNRDGRFEVVVTFSHDAGARTEVDVYSWNQHLLEPVRIAELDEAQKAGYRGGDEFAVREGQLVRMFQVYEEIDGQWSATAARRQLRYSFDDGKWAEWQSAPSL
jgi:hypothetical protein